MCKGCDSATDIQFTDDLEEQIEAEMKLIAETMGVEVHSHSLEILGIWLNTEFEGGRHQRRLDKINIIDAKLKFKSPG